MWCAFEKVSACCVVMMHRHGVSKVSCGSKWDERCRVVVA